MKYKSLIVGTALLIFSFSAGYLLNIGKQDDNLDTSPSNNTSIISPYSGQELRGIKSLSQDDIEGLMAGKGTPFGGMAKLAELNGYPGPRHLLDMTEEIKLTTSQESEIDALYEEMKDRAIVLGEKIIDLEQEMSDGFANKTISPSTLETTLAQSAQLYGQLRFVHLKYHFLTQNILSPEQVQRYNELRGYTEGGDPCENIPEGHDAILWKTHNNCN